MISEEEVNNAYAAVQTSRVEVFNAEEELVTSVQQLKDEEARLRREGVDGANKDEREANLAEKLQGFTNIVREWEKTVRQVKDKHQGNLLEVERIRLLMRLVENIDYIKGRERD